MEYMWTEADSAALGAHVKKLLTETPVETKAREIAVGIKSRHARALASSRARRITFDDMVSARVH